MERTLTLVVPEEIYTPLFEKAAQEGRDPELLAVELLGVGLQQSMHDPIEEFIGAFSSDIPDWTEKHDEYLGNAILDEMNKPSE